MRKARKDKVGENIMRNIVQIAKPRTLGDVDFVMLLCRLDGKWLFIAKENENGRLLLELPERESRSGSDNDVENAAAVLVFRLMHRFEFEIFPIFDCETQLDGETHYGRMFLMCADSRPDELEAEFYSVEENAAAFENYEQIKYVTDSANALAELYFERRR